MANEVTSSIISELYSDIVQAAQFTLSEGTVIRPLIRNYDNTGTPGLVAQVPIYPAIAAASVGDGDELSNVAFNTTEKTMTAAEVGTMVTLTDLANVSAINSNVGAAIGRQIGDAMAKKVDDDLAALFSGFSGSVGSGAAEVTVDLFFSAAATLRNNNAPGPYFCVIHPYQAYKLKSLLAGNGNTPMNNTDLANEALRTGYVGTIAGMQVFESSCVTGDSAGAYVGAAFSRDALGIMWKWNARIESQRDASLRATEIVGTCAYGVGEIIDGYGVGIMGDANL